MRAPSILDELPPALNDLVRRIGPTDPKMPVPDINMVLDILRGADLDRFDDEERGSKRQRMG